MPETEAVLDRTFHALADRSRRSIIVRLSRGPASVSELAEPLTISLPAVVQHLDVLQRSGLVRSEKAGRVRTCRLEPDGLRAAGIWMQGLGGFAPEDYDLLERLVAASLGAASAE